MTAPIRIRTKSGEVIDLAEMRSQAEQVWNENLPVYSPGQRRSAKEKLQLLDALDAALGVPPLSSAIVGQSDEMSFGNGWDAHERIVRQAAGVIESDAPSTSGVVSDETPDLGRQPMHTCQGGASIFAALCRACKLIEERGA